ncbi:hypothetical protein CEXT_222471 [Caerostris extrusa]|uniref:Uncharacterized protein n=1 Tax=Caerostris extrusa TaxID=172846 RepID=A0AAV4P4B5_CAEEX|nr:hypothetical protein CEXT_222471 [Caerostris extrusa]
MGSSNPQLNSILRARSKQDLSITAAEDRLRPGLAFNFFALSIEKVFAHFLVVVPKVIVSREGPSTMLLERKLFGRGECGTNNAWPKGKWLHVKTIRRPLNLVVVEDSQWENSSQLSLVHLRD